MIFTRLAPPYIAVFVQYKLILSLSTQSFGYIRHYSTKPKANSYIVYVENTLKCFSTCCMG